MPVNYFPGHMAKAQRQLKEVLPALDVGVIVLDARIPRSSLGLDLESLLGGRPFLYALNKADLADPALTAAWAGHLGSAVIIQAQSGQGIGDLADRALAAGRSRLRTRRPVRLVVLGIPNVGKSSLLNRLAGRRAAAVGDKPGVTRARQWIRARPDLEVLDTPGLLRPRLGDQRAAFLLALVASLRDELIGREKLSLQALSLIAERYPGNLRERYGIEISGDPQTDLENIGRARGLFLGGGRIDTERTAAAVLADLRAGRLGRMTFEEP